MKTIPLLAAAVITSAAFVPASPAQSPTTPAPAVSMTAGTNTDPTDLATALKPNQVVYAPRLPTPQELSEVAKAHGFTVDRIDQSANQITVAYKLPDGQRSVVGYVLLSSATAPGGTTAVVAPAPTVVYQTSPRVVYYDPWAYDSYDPWYYYPPVGLSFGFGFGHFRGGHGYYRGGGGFHHGWHR